MLGDGNDDNDGGDDQIRVRPSGVTYAFVIVPTLAFTLGIPFANHSEPHVFGLPFLVAYLVVWILVTPLFMYAAFRAMRVDLFGPKRS